MDYNALNLLVIAGSSVMLD